MNNNGHNRRLPSKESLISAQLSKKKMTKGQLAEATGLKISVIDSTLKNNPNLFKAVTIDGTKKWDLV